MKQIVSNAVFAATLILILVGSGSAAGPLDPCLPGGVKSSAAFNLISSQPEPSIVLVPGVPGKSTFVCGMLISGIGGSAMSVVAGSGTICGTNTVTLTGPIFVPLQTANGNTGTFGIGGALTFGTLFAARSGDDLCLIFDSGQSISGFVNYIQQ